MNQKTALAVFEVFPEDTPVQWTSKELVFIKNTTGDEEVQGSMVAGVRLPDQSIAVLRTTYGEALAHIAAKDASVLTGGRCVRVQSDAWPTSDECFAAILDVPEQG